MWWSWQEHLLEGGCLNGESLPNSSVCVLKDCGRRTSQNEVDSRCKPCDYSVNRFLSLVNTHLCSSSRTNWEQLISRFSTRIACISITAATVCVYIHLRSTRAPTYNTHVPRFPFLISCNIFNLILPSHHQACLLTFVPEIWCTLKQHPLINDFVCIFFIVFSENLKGSLTAE